MELVWLLKLMKSCKGYTDISYAVFVLEFGFGKCAIQTILVANLCLFYPYWFGNISEQVETKPDQYWLSYMQNSEGCQYAPVFLKNL